MTRAIRRHQKKVAQLRKLRVVLTGRSAWWKTFWMCQGELRPLWGDDEVRLWRPVNKQLMLTPGWWTRESMNQPARIAANRSCHMVERGCDPDTLYWPDFKRPYKYYW